MRSRVNRRAFLRNTALGGAGWLILKDSRSAFGYKANEKLNVALVGVAGRGSWFVGAIPRLGENVVAMQMGNQGTASRGFRKAVEIIQAGVLGEVREVHAWNTGGGAGVRTASRAWTCLIQALSAVGTGITRNPKRAGPGGCRGCGLLPLRRFED